MTPPWTPVHTDRAPAAIGPYTQAVVANGMVYTSGQIALHPDTGAMDAGDVAQQTERVVANLQAVLEAAGASLETVVKTTCFLRDMDDFAAFNAVYARHFTTKPARSCVAVAGLPRDARVEIEAVALLA